MYDRNGKNVEKTGKSFFVYSQEDAIKNEPTESKPMRGSTIDTKVHGSLIITSTGIVVRILYDRNTVIVTVV